MCKQLLKTSWKALMLWLAKIVRFPERHYPSTVVDGAGALLLHTGMASSREATPLFICGAQQSGIPLAEIAIRVSSALAMPYSLTVGQGAEPLCNHH